PPARARELRPSRPALRAPPPVGPSERSRAAPAGPAPLSRDPAGRASTAPADPPFTPAAVVRGDGLARPLWSLAASALRGRHAETRTAGTAPALLELARSGPAELAPRRPTRQAPLRIAAVIPSFRRG